MRFTETLCEKLISSLEEFNITENSSEDVFETSYCCLPSRHFFIFPRIVLLEQTYHIVCFASFTRCYAFALKLYQSLQLALR